MSAMIQNDEEKEWMLPLLTLRDELDVVNDKPLRDWRRMHGGVMLFHDQPVHGPYTQSSREHWLRRVLEAQTWIRQNGPDHMKNMDLITMPELHAIRHIWVFDKHEIEDSLPRIYAEVTHEEFPGQPLNEHMSLGADDIDILRDICDGDDLHFEMTRSLLSVERRYRTMARRAGLFTEMEDVIRRSFYEGVDDASERARTLATARNLRKGISRPTALLSDDEGALIDDSNEELTNASH